MGSVMDASIKAWAAATSDVPSTPGSADPVACVSEAMVGVCLLWARVHMARLNEPKKKHMGFAIAWPAL